MRSPETLCLSSLLRFSQSWNECLTCTHMKSWNIPFNFIGLNKCFSEIATHYQGAKDIKGMKVRTPKVDKDSSGSQEDKVVWCSWASGLFGCWVPWLVGFLARGCLSCWFLAWWLMWLVNGVVVGLVREWTCGLLGLAFMQIEHSNKWCLHRWVWRIHPANTLALSWCKLLPNCFSCWPVKSVGMGTLDAGFWVQLCDTLGWWPETCCHWGKTPTHIPGQKQMQGAGRES